MREKIGAAVGTGFQPSLGNCADSIAEVFRASLGRIRVVQTWR